MRITSVEVASRSGDGGGSRLLVLRTDTDGVGVGALGFDVPPGSGDGADGLSVLLVGRDPYDTQALLADARAHAPGSPVDHRMWAAAQAAMADLVGRELGIPVHQLLGGRVRDRIRACAIDWMGDSHDRSDLTMAARRAVAAGFTALRVEPLAGPPIREDARAIRVIDIVRTIRAAVPDEVDLVVDAAGTLAAPDAIELADALRTLEPLWLEDPFPPGSLEALRSLASRPTVPLAGGRRLDPERLATMAASGLVDHLIIDIGAVGGLHQARAIAAIAEISHIDVVPTAFGGGVGLATALQLAAAIPNLSMVELRPGDLPVEDGTVAVDLAPGLGAHGMATDEGWMPS